MLNISPEKIQAIDMDSVNAPIEYSFLSGVPANFREYFMIDPATGVVRQVRPVDSSTTKNFDIIIKVSAQRNTTLKWLEPVYIHYRKLRS